MTMRAGPDWRSGSARLPTGRITYSRSADSCRMSPCGWSSVKTGNDLPDCSTVTSMAVNFPSGASAINSSEEFCPTNFPG